MKLVDESLADHIGYLATQRDSKADNEHKQMRKDFAIGEQIYFAVQIKAFADAKQWDQVNFFIEQRKPPCPHAIIGEICNDAGNPEFAVKALRKIPDVKMRIELLMEFSMWKPAVEEIYANKKQDDFLEEVLARGPGFVGDFVRMEEQRLAVQ